MRHRGNVPPMYVRGGGGGSGAGGGGGGCATLLVVVVLLMVVGGVIEGCGALADGITRESWTTAEGWHCRKTLLGKTKFNNPGWGFGNDEWIDAEPGECD